MRGWRSIKGDVLPLDDKVDQIGKKRSSHKDSRRIDSGYESDSNESKSSTSDQESQEKQQEEMALQPNARPLEEYVRPTISTLPSSIALPMEAINYELKNLHFSVLPEFHGLPSEDALTFIKDYYATIQTFPLGALTEDQLRMRCFPYTLKDKAKKWLMSLPPGSLTDWTSIYNKFVENFYSHAMTTNLRRQIPNFQQADREAFHEAWGRFKMLLMQCPHHNYSFENQMQFFCDGLIFLVKLWQIMLQVELCLKRHPKRHMTFMRC